MVTVENTHSRKPVLHRVGGGRYSWKPNVNFTDWAIDEQFFVGGWLYFGFNKQLYSVMQVNETSYTNCIEENFITTQQRVEGTFLISPCRNHTTS
ncbi:hypothetical protein Godav_008334 [Gossypium davidsonii]|uniref:Phytocyanin domain-containing protein n=2 Tax=Gossypium TaxID=3633 RepID=A0A7J8S9S8_GOSDV|nr:hypothetical protein [Gossypium davidsonii]MBA0658360.1 hypothetical protein [Gossypium klotzschianum]